MQIIGDNFSFDSQYSLVGKFDNYMLKAMPMHEFKTERYLRVFSAVLKCFSDDVALAAITAKLTLPFLKEEAERFGIWSDYTDARGVKIFGMETGFLKEVRKTTSVLTLTESGWETLDYTTAPLPEYVREEWENTLSFFIVLFRTIPRKMYEVYMNALIQDNLYLTCLDWAQVREWVALQIPQSQNS